MRKQDKILAVILATLCVAVITMIGFKTFAKCMLLSVAILFGLGVFVIAVEAFWDWYTK